MLKPGRLLARLHLPEHLAAELADRAAQDGAYPERASRPRRRPSRDVRRCDANGQRCTATTTGARGPGAVLSVPQGWRCHLANGSRLASASGCRRSHFGSGRLGRWRRVLWRWRLRLCRLLAHLVKLPPLGAPTPPMRPDVIGRYPSFNLVQIRSHVVLRPTRAPARAHEFHQPPAIIIVDIHLIGIRQPLCSMQRGRVNVTILTTALIEHEHGCAAAP